MIAPSTAPITTRRGAVAGRDPFDRRLEHVLRQVSSTRPACLVHLDVAGAAGVLDAAGARAHRCLKSEVARVVAAHLDDAATWAPARGCSFNVLLEGAGEAAARECTQQLKTAVDSLQFEWHGHPFRLQVYAGVVVLDSQLDEPRNWLARASEACAAAHELAGCGVQVIANDPAAWSHMRQNREWVRHLSEIIG